MAKRLGAEKPYTPLDASLIAQVLQPAALQDSEPTALPPPSHAVVPHPSSIPVEREVVAPDAGSPVTSVQPEPTSAPSERRIAQRRIDLAPMVPNFGLPPD